MIAALAILGVALAGQTDAGDPRQFSVEANIFAVEDVDLGSESITPLLTYTRDNSDLKASYNPLLTDLGARVDGYNGQPIFPDPSVRVEMLSRPRMTVLAGQDAHIQMGQDPIQYMEPLGDDTFQLRSIEAGPALSLSVVVTSITAEGSANGRVQTDYDVNGDGTEEKIWAPSPSQAAEWVRLQMELTINSVSGRESLPSVDLPVGRPEIRRDAFEAIDVLPLDAWCLRALRAGDAGRYLVVALRVSDPVAERKPLQFSAESKVLAVPKAAWETLVAGNDKEQPGVTALRNIDANMPAAVADRRSSAEERAGHDRLPINVVSSATFDRFDGAEGDGPAVELISAPRVTWSPDPDTLFKVMVSSRPGASSSQLGQGGVGGGFGGGTAGVGGQNTPDADRPETADRGPANDLPQLMEWLEANAPALWHAFDASLEAEFKPVLVADTAVEYDAEGRPNYNGLFLVHWLDTTDPNQLILHQGLYFSVEDYRVETGFFGREKRESLGFMVCDGNGEAPIRAGDTVLTGFRMPKTGNVVLVFTTIQRIDASGSRTFRQE